MGVQNSHSKPWALAGLRGMLGAWGVLPVWHSFQKPGPFLPGGQQDVLQQRLSLCSTRGALLWFPSAYGPPLCELHSMREHACSTKVAYVKHERSPLAHVLGFRCTIIARITVLSSTLTKVLPSTFIQCPSGYIVSQFVGPRFLCASAPMFARAVTTNIRATFFEMIIMSHLPMTLIVSGNCGSWLGNWICH